MRGKSFTPTDEQKAVIAHSGSAFISACPGAGKTQVLVERARQELQKPSTGQGLAFLSFTNAAIFELRGRLQSEAILPTPEFPHYAGTFDTFIWQFFIAPFGIPGQRETPHLDIDQRDVEPYNGARKLSLSCFERATSKMIPKKAKEFGFDTTANPGLTHRYETSAKKCRERFLGRGELGFNDVRAVVREHLSNIPLATRLSAALSARFREIVVDEAQDCNPDDIEIINWLRGAGIVTKIICDPNQSVYAFRGGITDQLFTLRDSFDPRDQLAMHGNFRSSPNICKTIAAFRAPKEQETSDKSLGTAANDSTPIHILHYSGNSISASIGEKFRTLVRSLKLNPANCPVVSSARDAACHAVGQVADEKTDNRTLLLALAVTSFHQGVEVNARRQSLEALHKLVLELGEKMGQKTYHQYVLAEGVKPEDWRPEILELLQALRFDPVRDTSADIWLTRARKLLRPYLGTVSSSLARKLKMNQGLSSILASESTLGLDGRTIHSVKGKEFPGICVVLSTTKCKRIIDYLTTGQPTQSAEDARKLYVAASRAESLLAIAVPKSQGARLIKQIKKTGAEVTEIALV
jgi:hypothetical protein